ncbi:MAG TPA: 2-methylcitrate dehydratase [Bacillota bacterium]|nr:2-methylcitrate dehydratase [Bacillota bacterium]
MPYVEFKSVVKKVNLKPGGKKEIVLEINDSALNGKLDSLSEMIDSKVEVTLDSLVVNYNITLNAHTDKPIKEYKVDDKGVVQEIKPAGEQIEADLNLPPANVPTKEERVQVEKTIIDDFILSGLAPKFDDLTIDIPAIVKRKLDGETYLKIASELSMSSGKMIEMVDEYYIRVAPLANKWDEWRKDKDLPAKTDGQSAEEKQPDLEQKEGQEDQENGAA